MRLPYFSRSYWCLPQRPSLSSPNGHRADWSLAELHACSATAASVIPLSSQAVCLSARFRGLAMGGMRLTGPNIEAGPLAARSAFENAKFHRLSERVLQT